MVWSGGGLSWTGVPMYHPSLIDESPLSLSSMSHYSVWAILTLSTLKGTSTLNTLTPRMVPYRPRTHMTYHDVHTAYLYDVLKRTYGVLIRYTYGVHIRLKAYLLIRIITTYVRRTYSVLIRRTTTYVNYTICTVQCTMYTVNCSLYIVHCTLYNVQCTINTVVHATLYNVQCTVNNIYNAE